MGKFLLGFALGLGVGAAMGMLLTPQPGSENREWLRAKTDDYAGGDETPLGTVAGAVREQRSRLEEAIEAGRRASATRQAALWQQLDLNPPPGPPTDSTPGGAQIV